MHYGFAIQDNTHDSVDVEATVHAACSCFKMDCTLTRKLSLDLWLFACVACGCCLGNSAAGKELAAFSSLEELR